MKAEYDLYRLTKDTVYIVDRNRGKMSVTNDAEEVVADVYRRFPRPLIVYRDSEGNWDGLVHDKGIFKGFSHGGRPSDTP